MSDLSPPNATMMERALAGSNVLPAPEVIASLMNPWDCPASHLPWLAWALSVDEWDETWSEAIQRAVIAASIEIHRLKGTVAAVKKALSVLGHTGRLSEWWEWDPKGEPHTFRAEVEIDNRGMDEATATAIERQIIAVKPARSHFTFRLIAATRARVLVGLVMTSGESAEVLPFMIAEVAPERPRLRYGIGIVYWSVTTLYPR